MSGARILLKPNFNSPHSYPASSDPAFLETLVEVLRERGASEITIGDSSGLRWTPTEDVFTSLGVRSLAARLGVACVNFDDGPWRTVPVGGRHFQDVRIAEAAFRSDRIVYACCMKTHGRARFSLSLKHAVGFLPPELRAAMHAGAIEEKIAEINRAVTPDLIFIDGRKCFVSGGPAEGVVRAPGVVLAGTDRVAMDVEALRVLRSFFAFNRLKRNPWSHEQIRRSIAMGLGASKDGDYELAGGESR